MENRGSIFGVIIGMIIVGILFTFVIIDICKDLTVIDTRVETVNGNIYDCTAAYADRNGMTYIRKPYYMEIPTRNIKIIKRIR